MKTTKTIVKLEVILNKNNHKVWSIISHSGDPSLNGLLTQCGVPVQAEYVPVGTTYEAVTTLTVPDNAQDEKEEG